MDGRVRYMDNIFIERLWRSLKQEAVYLHEITNGFQAKRIIDNWIEFYNAERPHTALDKRTPDIAYFCHLVIRKAVRTHTRCILAKPQNCPKKQDHFNGTTSEIRSLITSASSQNKIFGFSSEPSIVLNTPIPVRCSASPRAASSG